MSPSGASVSTPISSPPSTNAWQAGCVQPFRDAVNNTENHQFVSNYQLYAAAGGVCMDHVSCVYEYCLFPNSNSSDGTHVFSHPQPENIVLTNEAALGDYTHAPFLPARVLHARSVADLLAAVAFGAVTLGVLAFGTGTAQAQTSDLVSTNALRVCADPANLPMSAKDGTGYENRLAEFVGEKLELPVRYTWYPMATGFVRNTLNAKACDVVIGYAQGHDE